MKNSIFRSKDFRIIEEPHGGVVLKHKIWSFFCFYENGCIGYYSADINTIKPFFSFDQLLYKGEVIQSDNDFIMGYVNYRDGDRTEYIFKFISSEEVEVFQRVNSNEDKEIGTFELLQLDFESISTKYGQIVENLKLRTKKGIETNKLLFKGDQIEVLDECNNLLKVEGGHFKKKTGWVPKDSVRMWKL